MAALINNETSRRKPSARTMPKVAKRRRTKVRTPAGGGGAFQMPLSESRSSTNTPEAPKIKVTTATMLAIMPLRAWPALSTRERRVFAPE